jgi:hypothetical protein
MDCDLSQCRAALAWLPAITQGAAACLSASWFFVALTNASGRSALLTGALGVFLLLAGICLALWSCSTPGASSFGANDAAREVDADCLAEKMFDVLKREHDFIKRLHRPPKGLLASSAPAAPNHAERRETIGAQSSQAEQGAARRHDK